MLTHKSTEGSPRHTCQSHMFLLMCSGAGVVNLSALHACPAPLAGREPSRIGINCCSLDFQAMAQLARAVRPPITCSQVGSLGVSCPWGHLRIIPSFAELTLQNLCLPAQQLRPHALACNVSSMSIVPVHVRVLLKHVPI